MSYSPPKIDGFNDKSRLSEHSLLTFYLERPLMTFSEITLILFNLFKDGLYTSI